MEHNKDRMKVHPTDNVGEKKQVNDAEERKPVIGVVTDCLELNLREKPNPNATVLTVISALTEVAVDMDVSTDSFYKVCTAAGIEGFCMRKYIAIRK